MPPVTMATEWYPGVSWHVMTITSYQCLAQLHKVSMMHIPVVTCILHYHLLSVCSAKLVPVAAAAEQTDWDALDMSQTHWVLSSRPAQPTAAPPALPQPQPHIHSLLCWPVSLSLLVATHAFLSTSILPFLAHHIYPAAVTSSQAPTHSAWVYQLAQHVQLTAGSGLNVIYDILV